jgi:hypothetical protein
VTVRVRNATSDNDQQAVPILIAPAAPDAPDLVTGSDTGSSTTDNITRLDNSTAANQLQFVVNNVLAGAFVQMTVGGVSIGSGTVPAGATSITITTNGSVDLTDGVHNVIVVQVLVAQQVNVGNFVDTLDLVSPPATSFSMTVDTTAPTITSTPPTTGDVGVPLSYNVESDEESAAGFVYQLIERPNGATINAATGQITWVPVLSQMGNQTFRVRGTDPAGNASADHVFTVVIANTQTGIAPAIDPIGDQTTSEGTSFSIDANATDGNLPNDLLTFSLVSPPTGMTIDPSTGVISWTPGESFGGQTLVITVRVTDAFELTDDETFELFINEVNQAPTISTIGNKSATVGQQLTFTVSASDADLPAPTLSYSLAAGAPAGAAINSSGLFTWTPTAAQLPGPHSITVRVSDGTATTDQTFSVTLINGAVQVVNGELVIEGTAGNDTVTIRGTSTPGRYEVTGSLGATTVNGVTGKLRLEFGDGNDTVILSGAFVAGDVLFDMGGGNDKVQFGDQAAVSSTGDFTVLLGAGDDELRMQRAYVVGDLIIDTGAGRDRLDLTGVSNATQFWAGSSSRGSMTIRTGDGDDEIDISQAFIVGATEVDAGAGNDSVRLASSAISGKTTLRGGDGNDSLTADGGYFLSTLVLDGALGADNLRILNSIAMGSASLAGGAGHDVGEVANLSVPHFNVSQGSGQDAVTMRGSALHSFFADLGDDNDALTLESNSIFGATSASGGAGASDLLADRGNVFGAPLLHQLFESLA